MDQIIDRSKELSATLVRFVILMTIKILARIFYRIQVVHCGEPGDKFRGVRVIFLLNHTSLFEPLYTGILPVPLIWKIAAKGIFPGADITMQRPVVGRVFKWLAPKAMTISRKRDDSWEEFMQAVTPDSLLLFAPEGRMRRSDGLDKHGQPMTCRGGAAEVLRTVGDGRLLLAYSGGLHHVQVPGQGMPRLFKSIAIALETIDLKTYLQQFADAADDREFRRRVAADLDHRRDRNVPAIPD